MVKVIRLCGALAICSALLWAFTGLSLWSSVEDSHGRCVVLVVLHFVAIVGAWLSFIKPSEHSQYYDH